MIILKKLPFVDTLASMQELAELDTLANLKKHLAALHSWVPSGYRKADYVLVIHAGFTTEPMRLYHALPARERKAVDVYRPDDEVARHFSGGHSLVYEIKFG